MFRNFNKSNDQAMFLAILCTLRVWWGKLTRRYPLHNPDGVTTLLRSSWIFGSAVYLIEEGGYYLIVDTSNKYRNKELIHRLETLRIETAKVKGIVLTHTHFDHTGSVAVLKRQCHQATVFVHEAEVANLQKGVCDIPLGANWLTSIMSWMGRTVSRIPGVNRLFTYTPWKGDVVKVTEKMTLEEYGFKNCEIVHTPGHSPGSMSVVYKNKNKKTIAFVGDAVGSGTVFNPLTDDADTMVKSLRKLLDMGVDLFFPGHGPPFTKEEVEKAIDGMEPVTKED